jgi:hypothetical protein
MYFVRSLSYIPGQEPLTYSSRNFTILGTICAPECLAVGGMTVPQ